MGGPLGAAAMRSVLEPVVTSGKHMYRIWAWKIPPKAASRSVLEPVVTSGKPMHQMLVWLIRRAVSGSPDDLRSHLATPEPGYQTCSACLCLRMPRLRLAAPASREQFALPAVVILRDKVEQDRFVVR